MYTPNLYKHGAIDNDFRNAFDDLFSFSGSAYPPYDIIQDNDTSYRIVLAVAGFTEKDIKITVKNDILYVEGSKADYTDKKDTKEKVLYRGIASRKFRKSFVLDSILTVVKASQQDGILTIFVEKTATSEEQIIEIKPQ